MTYIPCSCFVPVELLILDEELARVRQQQTQQERPQPQIDIARPELCDPDEHESPAPRRGVIVI